MMAVPGSGHSGCRIGVLRENMASSGAMGVFSAGLRFAALVCMVAPELNAADTTMCCGRSWTSIWLLWGLGRRTFPLSFRHLVGGWVGRCGDGKGGILTLDKHNGEEAGPSNPYVPSTCHLACADSQFITLFIPAGLNPRRILPRLQCGGVFYKQCWRHLNKVTEKRLCNMQHYTRHTKGKICGCHCGGCPFPESHPGDLLCLPPLLW
jgi:hypothetical protein